MWHGSPPRCATRLAATLALTLTPNPDPDPHPSANPNPNRSPNAYPNPNQWYWTIEMPVFMAVHGVITVVATGIFLVYLRTTVNPLIPG